MAQHGVPAAAPSNVRARMRSRAQYPILFCYIIHGTGMVPNVTGDACGHTTLNPTKKGPGDGSTSREPSRHNAPVSCVAYLRQRYRDSQFSEGAAKLLLSSWGQKSSKTYDSLFRKWASWCDERDNDPFSCPVRVIVNFLAYLFEQGYQYNSINAYRQSLYMRKWMAMKWVNTH